MKTFILAGNISEATAHYGKEIRNRIFGYIDSPYTLCGMRDIKIIKLGTYYKRKDLSQINEIIEHNKMITVLLDE